MFIPASPNKNGQQFTDQEVIRRYVEGKGEIWVNELYRRYIHLIYGSCLKFTADRNISKEITLLIFEKMLELLPRQSVEEVQNFNVWLFVLIKNTCISHLRKEKAEFNRRQKLKQTNSEVETFFENEGLQKLLSRETLVEQPGKLEKLISEALKELSAKQKNVYVCFFMKN
jgi:RNA polymerase sigma factor (sigma-70 family)